MATKFDLDKYGSLARESLLADLLELESIQASSGKSRSEFDLADFIRDASLENKLTSGWTQDLPFSKREIEEIFDDDDQDLSLTRADEQAQSVFNIIKERKFILGDFYPFDCGDSVSRTWQTPSIEHAAYLCFLELTLSHSFAHPRLSLPTADFELWCVSCFAELGYKTAGMMSQLDAGTFYARLKAAETTLETVSFEPERVILRKRQQDAKADLLAIHQLARDSRPGRHMWVGQATCGSSDTWESKSKEPSVEKWKSLACSHFNPKSVLLIPHHAMRTHLGNLCHDGCVPVFDRLRLVPFFSPPAGLIDRCFETFRKIELEDWGRGRPNFVAA
jgi:hypothetical protein